jgi:hypothetical protein
MKTTTLPRSRTPVDNGENAGAAQVVITPPNFKTVVFNVQGDPEVPLVVNRMSNKLGDLAAPPPGQKRKRSNVTPDQMVDRARYVSREGWDGIPTSMARNSLIAACRFADAKQINAKGAIFVEPDGVDALEPQTLLLKIEGAKAQRQDDIARNRMTGAAIECHRPAYFNWRVNLRIRYDADQFSLESIANLLHRAGSQIGWGVGRPSSSRSNGMGWGTFHIETEVNK